MPGERDKWAHIAQGMGLSLYFGPKMMEVTGGFHRMKHALYPTQGWWSEPGHKTWLGGFVTDGAWWAHGEWKGTEVVAGLPYEAVQEGSGDDARTVYEPRTVLAARIQPSLNLGFAMTMPKSFWRDPYVAMEPERARWIFQRFAGGGLDAVDQVNRALASGMRIRIDDSTVTVIANDVHVRDLDALLDGGALVAQRLAQARRGIPPNALEAWVRTTWSQVAEAEHLAFDPDAFTIAGRLHGFDVSAALYVESMRHATDVRVTLARPLSEILYLRIRRETTGDKLTKWLDSETEVGDPLFDWSFHVTGGPPDRLRALLGEAARARVKDVLAWSYAVTIKGDQLWAHCSAPLDGAQLSRALADATALAAALTPVMLPTGPYRA